MYKILILYNAKNHLWKQYGTTTTTTSAISGCNACGGGAVDEVFTEFETDDLELLKEELIKVDAIYGHENIKAYKDLDTVYTVDVTEVEPEPDDEEDDDLLG